MNSPHTGKPMPLRVSSPVITDFKGETFRIEFLYYLCTDTQERFSDETLDNLNRYQAYQQYAAKHNLPIEEVMPKEMVQITEPDNTLDFQKLIADVPQEVKDHVDKMLNDLDRMHQDELELLSCPGDTIKETIEEMKIGMDSFAWAMKMTIPEAENLISGKLPITTDIADLLEAALDIDAQFWLNREALYREKLAKLTNNS
jgi:plasmid maintenance system antidote protein VapI